MLRVSSGVLRQTLLSALGLVPLACGGSTTGSPGAGGTAPSPAAGAGGASAGSPSSAGGGGVATAGSATAGAATAGSATAGSGGANTAGAGGAAPEPPFPCEDSISLAGQSPGYATCGENGYWHRPERLDCPLTITDQEPAPGFNCVKDADCGAGSICVCGKPSRCMEATCTVDADCGAGFLCRGYATSPCGFSINDPERFACQTSGDVCEGFTDCTDGYRCGGDSGSFQCDVPPVNPACGRPFLVEGGARVASVCERDDWSSAIDGDGALPHGELRARLGAEWTRIAQLEHASVAAFARFSLQLLQLGAPADLVERAARAMQDEARHARLAFALASACAGKPLGPGALDVARSLEATSLAEVLRLVFREGCVGETVAALQMQEAAAHVVDAPLRAELTRVAADEAAHAELAWRFVGWVLERDRSLAAVVREELERARRESSEASAGDGDEALLAFGILSSAREHAVRHAAFQGVISPCAVALLSRGAPGVTERVAEQARS